MCRGDQPLIGVGTWSSSSSTCSRVPEQIAAVANAWVGAVGGRTSFVVDAAHTGSEEVHTGCHAECYKPPRADHGRSDDSARQPAIRGTRVSVQSVLELLAAGMTFEEMLADYPYLELDDLLAALEYCALASSGQHVVP